MSFSLKVDHETGLLKMISCRQNPGVSNLDGVLPESSFIELPFCLSGECPAAVGHHGSGDKLLGDLLGEGAATLYSLSGHQHAIWNKRGQNKDCISVSYVCVHRHICQNLCVGLVR